MIAKFTEKERRQRGKTVTNNLINYLVSRRIRVSKILTFFINERIFS